MDGADAVAVVARRKGKRVPLREFLDELAPRCPCALCDLALQSGRSPAVKLYKILWFADIEHYRLTGRSITGAASYTKRQYGPVPKGIMQALTTLEGEGKIAKSSANYYGGPKTMFLACEGRTCRRSMPTRSRSSTWWPARSARGTPPLQSRS